MGAGGGVDPIDTSILLESGQRIYSAYKNKMGVWVQLGCNMISHVCQSRSVDQAWDLSLRSCTFVSRAITETIWPIFRSVVNHVNILLSVHIVLA
jgi:hypothetical protein